MDTVHPAYQQDPLGDDMQAYDAYPPAPDVNFMCKDPSGMNTYGALYQSHWGQWWSPTEDASFAEAINMTPPPMSSHDKSPSTTTPTIQKSLRGGTLLFPSPTAILFYHQSPTLTA
ncbi:uncharacterized protein FPRO_07122 [Fusarium proliferatum ET1]|uniref:Uncharacterized protein n=1 Tax=Fusarium proliferatum (strain ET1) TaxID=1227346 RepID=A0A1L7VA86_FUSPR|nr:uncharacterized protein FPRO_07122 [Fusarium proliferatum ET1]CZR37687.1 uncharacterized protein FPRO_07122 [Fusarium proliferatum ET1]